MPVSFLLPIAVGLAATVLATLRLVTWAAVGAWVCRDEGDAVMVPLGIVVGAAVTGCCYAVCALVGRLDLGLGLDGGIAVVAVLCNHRIVRRAIRDLGTQAIDLARTGRWTRIVAIAWVCLAWLTALAPPRDADVLRYHLAHVRQIILEGQWTKIIDTAYALPFGWSLTYLPFELLHLSVAAHMLNLMVWIVLVLALYRELRERDSAGLRLLVFALACQPMVFKAVTTAHADAYTMMLVAIVALLIQRGPELTLRRAVLLGFAAWIGAQSRYQALGIGLAATATLVAFVVRGTVRPRALAAAGLGGLAAAVLAAPFYIANFRWFGDPVWPLFVRPVLGSASAVDRVALVLAQRTSAPLALHWLPRGLYRLAIDITVFPTPWIVAAAIVSAWFAPRTRWLAAFVTCYVVIWALVEPSLFPRFIIFLVPAVPLLAGDALARLPAVRPRLHRLVTAGLATLSVASALLVLAYSGDAVRYAVSGDREQYERATWFAPVFRWANTSTPRTARFLVVVKTGGTYALDRPYRRADPEGSAEVDWSALPDPQALVGQLQAGGFLYVIYEDRDWSLYPGGADMMRLVHDAVAQGLLVPVETFSLQLVTSRLLGHSVPSTVEVVRVPSTPSGR